MARQYFLKHLFFFELASIVFTYLKMARRHRCSGYHLEDDKIEWALNDEHVFNFRGACAARGGG